MSNSVLSPFGEIPNDWEYQIVIDNVDFLTGPTFDSSLFNTESRGARLVRGINLTKGSTRWSEEKTKYWDVELDSFKKFQLAVNDILIGMDGSLVGKNYAYLKDSDLPALLVQRVARLRAKGNLHPKYLYYMYATDFWLDYVEVVKTNSGIPHISNGDIKNFRFPFPPLPEQQKIAAILTSVDDVIEKTQAQINKLKDLKTGMMQELLTRGVGVDGKPHTEFKDSPVGRIPKGWDVISLDSVAQIQTGAAKSSKLTGELIELPYLRVANVQDGFLDLKEIKIIKIPKNKSNRYLLQPNDVLVNEGGDFDKLGRGSIWSGQITPCAHQNHVFVVRPNIKKLSPKFFNHLSGSEYGKKYYMGCAKQTTNLASINSSQLKQFPILLPSLKEQEDICRALDSVDQNISNIQLKLSQHNNLKKALMQDLLTGKVRVNVD